jgi:hypothetical protein
MVTSLDPGVPRSEKFWKYFTRGFFKILEMYVASNFKMEAVFLKNFGTKLLDYTAS